MLSVSLLMGGMQVTAPLEVSASTTIKNNVSYSTTANLNMRSGASTKYRVMTTIPKGKQVTYVSKHGSWYKVKYGSKTGYVSSKYLKAKTATSSKMTTTSSATKYATTYNLNLRSSSSTKSKVLTTIPKGKHVTYISKRGSWYKVKYGSKTGYVSSKYLKKVTATPKPSNKPKPSSPPKVNTPAPSLPTGGAKPLGQYFTIDSLNLRQGDGIEHAIIVSIPKNASVEHLATKGNWYKVKYGKHIGWVNASYLSKTQLKENEPNAGVKWLSSEEKKRTAMLISKMKTTPIRSPFIVPTVGAVSSPYGIRTNPTDVGYEFHTGVDYANSIGTPVLATAYAMVDRTVTSNVGYGNYVILRHDLSGITFYSLYGHLDKILVKPGQKVSQGQQIGEMGTTGRSTGPHLHFEIQNESRQNVNPDTLLRY